MTDQRITEPLDDREWFAHGVWVAAPTDDGPEPLTMCRTVEQAAEVVRDHNALVRELARSRGVVQAVDLLHRPMRMMSEMGGAMLCEECVVPFPCSTAATALAAAEGLPVPTDTPASETRKACACRVNAAGDIRCHNCGQYVNVRCWNCGTPRGEGDCPSSSAAVPTDEDTR